MKPTGWLIGLYSVILLQEVALGAQIPSRFERRVERVAVTPLWISAETVADSEKIIDLDLINDDALRMRVEKQKLALGDRLLAEKSEGERRPPIAEITFSDCKWTTFSTDHVGGTGSTATLSDLASNSGSILHGVIRAVDVGFDFGVPSSLLAVEVSEAIKGTSSKSLFYITYPVAHFRIGPLHFCNATRGFEPRPGDEIILFDYTGPVDRDGILYAPRMDQIFFQDQTGALILPSPLKDTPDLKTARTLDDVAGQLRSTLETLGSRRGIQ